VRDEAVEGVPVPVLRHHAVLHELVDVGGERQGDDVGLQAALTARAWSPDEP
jgi:hypothetical protein